MYDQYRALESSLHEMSRWVERTLNVLTEPGFPVAQTYLAAMRVFRKLSENWSRHLEIERELFPRMLCRNLLPAESLQRLAENNQVIAKHLAAILAAPWPRSPQAGLQSIRTSGAKALTRLLAQIDAERTTILPAILRMDRRVPVAAHVEVSELVTT